MNRQELINHLLENFIIGLDKIEKNNQHELLDLAYCHEQNRDIKKLIESCDIFLVSNLCLNQDEIKDNNMKESELNRSRASKLASSQSLGQESSSLKNPKTPVKVQPPKSVGKNREGSTEKENKLFKTKTLANLNSFSNTAKNLKNDNKSLAKTPTSNKSALFNSEKENSTNIESSSKNKTFILEKMEPTLKREKTNTTLIYKDEKSKTPREKITTKSVSKKDISKPIVKPTKLNLEPANKQKEENNLKRNHTTLNVTNNTQNVNKEKNVKNSINNELAKLEKKDKLLIDNKKLNNLNEKETLKTNNTSNYGSNNKNENLSSPSNEVENNDNKYLIMVTSTENTNDNIIYNSTTNLEKISVVVTMPIQVVENKVIPKVEEKIDLQVLIERKNTCIQYAIDRFVGKYEIPSLLGVNKKIAKSGINHLVKIIKNEIPLIEEKLKVLKEKNSLVELSKDIPSFNVARGTIKAVELLNEALYNKLFYNNSNVPSEDILMPYKIYFQLLVHNNSLIKDDKEFWENCCKYFINESNGKTGDFINNSIKKFDFSDENIYKILKIIGNREKKITPTFYSKTCGTTGLIIFLIKDTMEYAGLIVDKKTLPARLYRLNNYLLSKSKLKLDKLDLFEKKFLKQEF